MALLPQFVFRVVHSESAGGILQKPDCTWILSHASWEENLDDGRLKDSPTSFSSLLADDITSQLKNHISGRYSDGGLPFSSRWISWTDSFEAALNRAQRYLTKGYQDVKICIIDTHPLQESTLVMLLFLAMKAYNVSSKIIAWKDNLYRYNSLTEWVFWDRIKVAKVDIIDYKDFARPARTDNKQWQLHLRDVLPEVIAAGTHADGSRRGIARTVLCAQIYHSRNELAETAHFEDKIYATRNGPLPVIPKAAKNDKRSNIEPAYVDSIWTLAGKSEKKDILFVWILSLMTKKYYIDSIVTAIVNHYPTAITQRLETIHKDDSNESESMLVYYMPSLKCLARVDINNYHRLMRCCIEKWTLVQKLQMGDSGSHPNVYVVAGSARPVRNLTELKQEGLLGGCEAILSPHSSGIGHLSYAEIEKTGHKVVPPETDEEFNARMLSQYNGEFWMPDNILSTSITRVNNASKSAAATSTTVCLTFTSGHGYSGAGDSTSNAENRLRLKQTLPPPSVGNVIA